MQEFVIPSFYSLVLMFILGVLAFLAEVLFLTTKQFWHASSIHNICRLLHLIHLLINYLTTCYFPNILLQVLSARGLHLEKTSKVLNVQYIEVLFFIPISLPYKWIINLFNSWIFQLLQD